MQKLKLLFLIFLMTTLCTGCTIEYNIDITKNEIKEEISVIDNISSTRNKEDILNHYNMWYPTFVNYIKDGESIEIEDFNEKVDGIEYHNKEIKETTSGYNYTYKYTYDIDEYYDSYVLANTFLETTIYNGNNTLVLRTSKENLLCQYDYFDSLKVNITIDPEVYVLNYTNTSNINNNTYTWTLNKNNCKDSQIILTLNEKDLINLSKPSSNENDSKIKQENNYELYILLGIIIVVIVIIYIWFMKFKEKNNGID